MDRIIGFNLLHYNFNFSLYWGECLQSPMLPVAVLFRSQTATFPAQSSCVVVRSGKCFPFLGSSPCYDNHFELSPNDLRLGLHDLLIQHVKRMFLRISSFNFLNLLMICLHNKAAVIWQSDATLSCIPQTTSGTRGDAAIVIGINARFKTSWMVTKRWKASGNTRYKMKYMR